MADLWLVADRLFDGTRLRPGALRLEAGLVAELADAPPPGAEARKLAGTLTPGFVDLQVNGGGDVLFNNSPSPEGIARIVATHRALGTAWLMPTVITDAPDVLAAAVEAALAAQGMPGLLGIHIEGPHISLGRRGTHAARYVRPVGEDTLAHVRRLRAAGLPVMITVAPENANPQQVAALASTGAVVSLGHTEAGAEETRASLAAGARAFTHLFNAMPPLFNRAPGVAGAAIGSDAHAGIICDGIHVADEMLALAIRARPVAERMFLISDAMPTVGGSGRFDLYGKTLRVENGRLVNDEGTLAGAHVTMAEGLARLIGKVGVAPEAALAMATRVPAGLMGMGQVAQLEGRPVDEVNLLDGDWRFTGTLAAALESAPAASRG